MRMTAPQFWLNAEASAEELGTICYSGIAFSFKSCAPQSPIVTSVQSPTSVSHPQSPAVQSPTSQSPPVTSQSPQSPPVTHLSHLSVTQTGQPLSHPPKSPAGQSPTLSHPLPVTHFQSPLFRGVGVHGGVGLSRGSRIHEPAVGPRQAHASCHACCLREGWEASSFSREWRPTAHKGVRGGQADARPA